MPADPAGPSAPARVPDVAGIRPVRVPPFYLTEPHGLSRRRLDRGSAPDDGREGSLDDEPARPISATA
jgi:hypothetical protein